MPLIKSSPIHIHVRPLVAAMEPAVPAARPTAWPATPSPAVPPTPAPAHNLIARNVSSSTSDLASEQGRVSVAGVTAPVESLSIIWGTVWHDGNGNGKMDVGEATMQDFEISLWPLAMGAV